MDEQPSFRILNWVNTNIVYEIPKNSENNVKIYIQ